MMKKGEWLLILFNLAYIIPFTAYYIYIKNFEFLIYIAVLLALFGLVAATLRKTKFSYAILWGLSIWGLLHMMGGGVRVGGSVLYAFRLIPIVDTPDYFILKYDQLVHGYLYFVMTFVIYHLIKPHINKKTLGFILYVFIVAASVGIGAGNEIVEFMAVLFIKNTGVGGYYNTAWDLVFNTLGALLAAVIIGIRRNKGIY